MTQRQSIPCAHCGAAFVPHTRSERPKPARFCSRPCVVAAKACGYPARPVAEYLWDGVEQGEGCWLRHQSPHAFGYSTMVINGRRELAHRVSYALAYGPFDPNLHCLHRCDTPACIRPDHLFLGTQADNMADMTTKGRRVRGERAGGAKLTTEDVRAIRRRHAQGESQRVLARAYGVHQPQISRIVNGTRWAHLS